MSELMFKIEPWSTVRIVVYTGETEHRFWLAIEKKRQGYPKFRRAKEEEAIHGSSDYEEIVLEAAKLFLKLVSGKGQLCKTLTEPKS